MLSLVPRRRSWYLTFRLIVGFDVIGAGIACSSARCVDSANLDRGIVTCTGRARCCRETSSEFAFLPAVTYSAQAEMTRRSFARFNRFP